MCAAKWIFKVLVIEVIVEGCCVISSRSPNGTAEILWKLSNQALQSQSRQTGYPYYPPPQSFMNALASVAYNDELHCVPRLLCELISGQTNKQSFLPFNINMDSFLNLLSSSNFGEVSPVLLFGRAALLGYTSQGNAASCSQAFPRCPNDPDKLVNYLNNYNGGFFRYFNGVPQRNGYRNDGGYYENQERILNKPSYSQDNYHSEIKFPNEGTHQKNYFRYKTGKTLTFPGDENKEDADSFRVDIRNPKIVFFPGSETNDLDFQKPLRNHVARPMIFPTRTGTGELILDNESFDRDYYNR